MKKLYTFAFILLLTQSAFAAEFFVRVPRTGYMTATVADQVQSNSNGIFRFFELPDGNLRIRIQDQYGATIFDGNYYLRRDQRVIAEVYSSGNLVVLETQNCGPGWNYGGAFPNNPPTAGNPGNGFPNKPNNGYDQNAFNQLLGVLKKESFDSNRLAVAKGYADKSQLSSRQIADMAKTFTFDSNKLEWAKYAYNFCYDPANYFLLKESFTFPSSYSDLQDFIGR